MDNPYQVSGAASDSSGYPVASLAGIQSLAATRPWVRLCAVVGFTIGGIFLLISLAAFVAGFRSASGVGELAFRVASAVPTLIISILSLALSGKLWGYGSAIARLLVSQAPADMDLALDAQRRFWRVGGIVLLCWVALIFIALVFAFFSGPIGR